MHMYTTIYPIIQFRVNQPWLTTLCQNGAHQSSRHQNMPHEKTSYSIYFHIKSLLVGGWPTPLKNDGVRQLGWWNSILFPINMESHTKFHGSSHHQPNENGQKLGFPLVLSSIVCCKIPWPSMIPWGWSWGGISLTISMDLYLINISLIMPTLDENKPRLIGRVPFKYQMKWLLEEYLHNFS